MTSEDARRVVSQSYLCPGDNEDLVQLGVMETAVRALSSSTIDRTSAKNWARTLHNLLCDRTDERVDRLLRADALGPLLVAFLEFGSQSAGSCLAKIVLYHPSVASTVEALARAHGFHSDFPLLNEDEVHVLFVPSTEHTGVDHTTNYN